MKRGRRLDPRPFSHPGSGKKGKGRGWDGIIIGWCGRSVGPWIGWCVYVRCGICMEGYGREEGREGWRSGSVRVVLWVVDGWVGRAAMGGWWWMGGWDGMGLSRRNREMDTDS